MGVRLEDVYHMWEWGWWRMCITCEGGGGCVSYVGVRVEEDVYHMWKLGWWRVCIICGSEGGGGCVLHVGVRVEEDVYHM